MTCTASGRWSGRKTWEGSPENCQKNPEMEVLENDCPSFEERVIFGFHVSFRGGQKVEVLLPSLGSWVHIAICKGDSPDLLEEQLILPILRMNQNL